MVGQKAKTWLLFTVLFLSFLYIYLISFVPESSQNMKFTETILGFILGTGLTTVINYGFRTPTHIPPSDPVISVDKAKEKGQDGPK